MSYFKYLTIISVSFLAFSCEQEKIAVEVEEAEERFPISELIQQKEYWEGSNAEFKNTFNTDEIGNIKLIENNLAFSGYIKIRALNGTITAVKSYTSGYPDGDFLNGMKTAT